MKEKRFPGIALFLAGVLAAGPGAAQDGSASEELPLAAQEESGPAEAPAEPPINWVDTTHSYATNRALALTQWMDDFFGDPTFDAERAESLLRLEFEEKWDTGDGNDFKVRLRGKVQLPKLSKRLNLVFSGEQGELADSEERELEDTVGLQYEVTQDPRSRFDLTLSASGWSPKPGVRYRNEGPIDDRHSYRFILPVQWQNDEGFYTIPRLDLNRALDENNILRWSNRLLWGEETQGVEWRTRLSLLQRLYPEAKKPVAMNYFFSVDGVTDPEYIKNYSLGLLWRRGIYRKYLFMEVEPSYNYRRNDFEDTRRSEWRIVLRLEIALYRDLRRMLEEDED